MSGSATGHNSNQSIVRGSLSSWPKALREGAAERATSPLTPAGSPPPECRLSPVGKPSPSSLGELAVFGELPRRSRVPTKPRFALGTPLPALLQPGASQGMAPPEWKAARQGGARLVSGSPPWPQHFSDSSHPRPPHTSSPQDAGSAQRLQARSPDLLRPQVFSPARGRPGARSSGTQFHPAP